MRYDFNADEIFELAMKIEENGAAFYRKAAAQQSDDANREMLQRLALMEDHHKSTFEAMRKTLSEAEKTQTLFDPQDESSQYLAAMAEGHGGEGSPKAADALTGKETVKEVIEIAMGLEKESILFYIGLRDMVPPQYGRDKMDDIIREERKHVIQLNTLLNRF